jgi:hypothetical protein
MVIAAVHHGFIAGFGAAPRQREQI